MAERTVDANPRGLVVDRLGVHLGGRQVVDAVSFVAAPSSVTVLLGPNGAGKSTIVRAVAGLLPHSGRIGVGTADLAPLAPRERARLVAYVPQLSALDAPLPVRDVVAQGRFAHDGGSLFVSPGAHAAEAIRAAMERTDVTAFADRPFSQLSVGERRRVLVARALAAEAPVLLLDEPTAALDVGHALSLLKVLRDVARSGCAVVIVLHHLQEAARVADYAILLAAGRIAHLGAPSEVIAPRPVHEVYGVDLVPNADFACRLPGEPSL